MTIILLMFKIEAFVLIRNYRRSSEIWIIENQSITTLASVMTTVKFTNKYFELQNRNLAIKPKESYETQAVTFLFSLSFKRNTLLLVQQQLLHFYSYNLIHFTLFYFILLIHLANCIYKKNKILFLLKPKKIFCKSRTGEEIPNGTKILKTDGFHYTKASIKTII